MGGKETRSGEDVELDVDQDRDRPGAELVRQRGQERDLPLLGGEETRQVGEGVEDQPPGPVRLHRGEELPGPRIGRELERRPPDDPDQPGPHVLPEVQPDPLGRRHQRLGGLVEARDQPGLPQPGALRQEVQAEQGLARPGGAEDHRAGASREPAPQHRVEAGDAEADPLPRAHRPRHRRPERRLQPREDLDPGAADREPVAAAQIGRTAQLGDPQPPRVPEIAGLQHQLQHAVDVGRGRPGISGDAAGQQHCRATEDGGACLETLDEAPVGEPGRRQLLGGAVPSTTSRLVPWSRTACRSPSSSPSTPPSSSGRRRLR